MKTRAAVLRDMGKDWEIIELDLDPPKEGEVLIRFAAAGLCHSDDHLRTGDIPVRYPIVEALTAVLFVLTAVRFGASSTLPAELFFVAGIVALAAVDLERYLLPRAILYPVSALVGAGLLGGRLDRVLGPQREPGEGV